MPEDLSFNHEMHKNKKFLPPKKSKEKGGKISKGYYVVVLALGVESSRYLSSLCLQDAKISCS